MRDFPEIFSVRLQDPQHLLPTRFAGLATLLTFADHHLQFFIFCAVGVFKPTFGYE
jgi:hypothetical protein